MLLLESGLAIGLGVLGTELLVPLPPIVRVLLALVAAVAVVVLVGSPRPVLAACAAAMVGLVVSLGCELLAVAGDAQRLKLLGGRRRN